MIIFLDVLPEEWGDKIPQQLEMSIVKLIVAYRDGQHRVIIGPQTVAELLKYDWSPMVRATLTRISNEHYSFRALLRSASYVLCIRLDGVSRPVQENWDAVATSAFASSQLNLSSVLLVENSDVDGKFLAEVLNIVARRRQISPIYIEIDHGGGEGIVNAFAQKIDQKRFCVCFIDCDKDTPYCPSPVKEAKLRALQERLAWKFARIMVLKCRELEKFA